MKQNENTSQFHYHYHYISRHYTYIFKKYKRCTTKITASRICIFIDYRTKRVIDDI